MGETRVPLRDSAAKGVTVLSQLRGWEWLIIVALVLLFFGAKRMPDAARGLGRSLRIFKAETKDLAGDVGVDDLSGPAR